MRAYYSELFVDPAIPPDKPATAQASTTDPEARGMQFSDGGYRPGYNVQYATDAERGLIR